MFRLSLSMALGGTSPDEVDELGDGWRCARRRKLDSVTATAILELAQKCHTRDVDSRHLGEIEDQPRRRPLVQQASRLDPERTDVRPIDSFRGAQKGSSILCFAVGH